VLASPNVDWRLLSDAADLPRLRLAVDMTGEPDRSDALREHLRREQVERQIELLMEPNDLEKRTTHLVLTSCRDWTAAGCQLAISQNPQLAVLVTDLSGAESPIIGELNRRGLSRVNPLAPLFARTPPQDQQSRSVN
jgi:hypothetical protein